MLNIKFLNNNVIVAYTVGLHSVAWQNCISHKKWTACCNCKRQ